MTNAQKPAIFAVVGPTASGKTALAVELAKRCGGEIVCCDSMQLYRGMDIGTAKPTAAERQGVPHHLFDVLSPEENCSVNDYVKMANDAVSDIVSRGKLPIFCGGTGLYLDAFLRGGDMETPPPSPEMHAELSAFAEREGEEALHARLGAVDAESAAAIHPHNRRRVIRALEIYLSTGVPKSEWDRRSLDLPPRYKAVVVGLFWKNRDLLYARIERRVEEMLAAGLEEETRRLAAAGVFRRSATAAAAIGYKELLPYLDGRLTREAAIEDLKTATRRYAKRQITWFSAKPYVRRLFVDDGEQVRNFEEIVNTALSLCASDENMV